MYLKYTSSQKNKPNIKMVKQLIKTLLYEKNLSVQYFLLIFEKSFYSSLAFDEVAQSLISILASKPLSVLSL